MRDKLERARRQLSYYSGIPENIEVLAVADMLWSGWECDYTAVLYRELPDGDPKPFVLAGVEVSPKNLKEALLERVEAYKEAVKETESFLRLLDAGNG
jgi:hypothetical protein